MTSPSPASVRWWHLYAGTLPDGAAVAQVLVKACELGPDDNTLTGSRAVRDDFVHGDLVLPYVASWDHEPTDLEQWQATPEHLRDTDPPTEEDDDDF